MKLIFFKRKKSYEYFSDFFGPAYFKFVVFVAHIIFFQVAIVMCWTSPVLTKLCGTDDNPLGNPISTDEVDLIGSLMNIGAAIGPILFIPAAEYFGKKSVLVFISCIIPLTYCTLIFARVVELYYICRVLQGIFLGVALNLQPIYVAEILPDEDRDIYMSLGTIFGFAGLLGVFAIGPFIPLAYFNSFLVVLSCTFLFLFAFGCPNTPFDVMKSKGKDATNELLMVLRKEFKNKEADEIESIIQKEVRGSFLELFKSFRNLKILIMATIPLLLQQLSGISLLLSYSQLIFEKTDIFIAPPICSLIVACFQALTSFFTPILLTSGRFSLRVLLLFCLFGMAFSNFVVSFYFFVLTDSPSFKWLPLLGLILFVPFYNCGIDPIPWMVVGQIYPKNIISVGTALSISLFFLASFPSLFLFSKIPLSFLYLSSGCFCCLGIPYVLFIFTEPKKC